MSTENARLRETPVVSPPKIRLATVWLGGCSGCHMSFLDLDEKLLELAERVTLVYSPIADVKEFPEGVDVALVEGAVANAENLHLAHQVRSRSQLVISFGDCAVTGNVPGMRNRLEMEKVLDAAYGTGPQRPPNGDGVLPPLLPKVLPLHQVIPVDGFLPGCPPSARRIWEAICALLPPLPATTGPVTGPVAGDERSMS